MAICKSRYQEKTLLSIPLFFLLMVSASLFSCSSGCDTDSWRITQNTFAEGGLPFGGDLEACKKECNANKQCYAFDFYKNMNAEESIQCWLHFNNETGYQHLGYDESRGSEITTQHDRYAKVCGCGSMFSLEMSTFAVGGRPVEADKEMCLKLCSAHSLCYAFDFYPLFGGAQCLLLYNNEAGYKLVMPSRVSDSYLEQHTRRSKACL